MPNKHKYYDVIVAWANGEKIQYNCCSEGWVDYDFIDIPRFSDKITEWRIKPKPKTVTKYYRMALHSDGSVGAYSVNKISISTPVDGNIEGFLKWVGDVATVEIEV